jgi:membrane protease YdiL (CAAX protease family)
MTTSTADFASTAQARTGIRQLSTSVLIALHIVPGALMTAAFVAFAPIAAAAGLPPIAALVAAIGIVLVPVELGILAWAARREGVTLGGAITYRRPIAVRRAAWLVPMLILLGFLGFGLHQAIEPGLIQGWFSWLPDWYVTPIQMDRVGDYGATAWIVTLAAYLALNGFLGPIVEELYFRGFLLPRMERFGRWAPLVNVTLFSVYHFWSPWQIVARVLGIGPTVYAVQRTRSVYVGMAVHCFLNTLSVVLVTSMILGRL